MDWINDMVSIITPMYNAEHYIEETIKSVLAQTYTNWEMIIIDDVSTDNGSKIVREYTVKDNRIIYHRLNQNSGVSNARNEAIKRAKGRYLAFLDSDDLWKSYKLEKQLQFMKENDYAFIYSQCEVIDENGRYKNQIRYVPENVEYKELLRTNVIPCLTVMIDRSKIKNIQFPNIKHEDYALWLSILKNNVSAYGMKEVLASYRIGHTSVSSNKLKVATWTWNIYRSYLGLGLLKSIICFVLYVFYGVKKRCVSLQFMNESKK